MLFDNLSDRQIEAVKAEEKRILVLAGAGSGKRKFKSLDLYQANKIYTTLRGEKERSKSDN